MSAATIPYARRGFLLVLSSPSGAGKSTLTRALLNDPDEAGRLQLSVSATTRGRRASEVEGVHYHFVGMERFQTMREGGELVEWAEVHGNCYGTPRAPVEQALAGGFDMVFDIDWQGARQMVAAMRPDVVSVFVLPPAAKDLRSRLIGRAEDADDVIARRLQNARGELEHWVDYDYVLVNDDLTKSYAGLKAILNAERLKRARGEGLPAFIASIQNDL
ncbi:guanylate kinase [Pseudoxanthobacter sp.]|uniref:guanylate kinase n=1 Tax=Pseudoxanthobacter sp. TaxID=1925742 RepID=UPI002FDF7826